MIKFLKVINHLKIEFTKYFNGAFKQIQWRIDNKHNHTIISKQIKNPKIIVVGRQSYGTINVESYENKSEKLIIGDFVSIANNSKFILGGNHKIDTFTTFPLKAHYINEFSEDDAQTKGPIIVEDEVWIGHSVIILSGVRVGKGAIVATGSVVTKDVLPFSIVGGNPAKFIKWRFPEELIEIRSKYNLNDFTEEDIKNNLHLFYNTLDISTLMKIENLKRKNG